MSSSLAEEQKKSLLEAARSAAKSAYCPYSHFHVGAAILADDEIITGCNVENASYGLTTCAERVALFRAVAMGKSRIQAIAVSCLDAPADGPLIHRMPCGACRQVMAEFAEMSVPVLVDGAGEFSLGDLLPFAFRLTSEENE